MVPESHSHQNGSRHLISDEWLVSYAAGNLSEAKSALVATHASYHPALQQKIRSAEAMGGALIEASETAEFSDGFYDRLLTKIDTEIRDAEELSGNGAAVVDAILPKPLVNYLEHGLSDLKWRFMGPGMSQVKLHSSSNGEKLWLLKAKGGTEIPSHGHNGHEFTLVLQGSYSVDGQLYSVGDMELASDDIDDHRPVISEGKDCICLVVTEAPINLKSLVGKLFQPFIGL